MALSLGDWTSADKLLEWPGPDLRFDERLDDLTEAVERLLAARDELEAAHPDVADAVDGFHESLTDWLAECRGQT